MDYNEWSQLMIRAAANNASSFSPDTRDLQKTGFSYGAQGLSCPYKSLSSWDQNTHNTAERAGCNWAKQNLMPVED
jgi:hypothetical protein